MLKLNMYNKLNNNTYTEPWNRPFLVQNFIPVRSTASLSTMLVSENRVMDYEPFSYFSCSQINQLGNIEQHQ